MRGDEKSAAVALYDTRGRERKGMRGDEKSAAVALYDTRGRDRKGVQL